MCDALRKGWWGGNWEDLFTYKKKREKSIARKIKEILPTVLKAKRKQNRGNKRQKSDMKKKNILFANIIMSKMQKMNFQRLLILWKIIKYTYATTQFEKNHCSTCQFLHAHTTSFTFFLLPHPHLIRFIFTGNELWFFFYFYLQKKFSEYKDMRKSKEKHWNLSGEQ